VRQRPPGSAAKFYVDLGLGYQPTGPGTLAAPPAAEVDLLAEPETGRLRVALEPANAGETDQLWLHRLTWFCCCNANACVSMDLCPCTTVQTSVIYIDSRPQTMVLMFDIPVNLQRLVPLRDGVIVCCRSVQRAGRGPHVYGLSPHSVVLSSAIDLPSVRGGALGSATGRPPSGPGAIGAAAIHALLLEEFRRHVLEGGEALLAEEAARSTASNILPVLALQVGPHSGAWGGVGREPRLWWRRRLRARRPVRSAGPAAAGVVPDVWLGARGLGGRCREARQTTS
jgi:hypothetical protein